MTAAAPLRESDWARAVEDTFDLCRWRWVHFRPARTKAGKWVTPTSGSGSKGWPDYFAVRDDRALAIELKRAGGRTSPEQSDWIAAMQQTGIEAHVITMPRDFDFFLDLTAREPEQLTMTSNSTGSTWTPG
jgi:hypothetical protein